MKHLTAFLIAITFLFTLNFAHASLYVGYSDSDYHIEVLYGNSYQFMPTPYTYTYSDQYYFDYPFRVYSHGDYSYYNSGWYGFDAYTYAPDFYYDTSYRFAPDFVNYTYYPSSYYYYSGNWAYYPNWMSAYAPIYYGNYYLPPSSQTLVGQQFQPVQEAFCDQAEFSSSTISIDADKSKQVTIYLNNFSPKYMDVENVSITDNFGLEATNIRFDRVVANNSKGKVQFELNADSSAKGIVEIEIKGAVTFRDGTYCPPSDIFQKINVNVYKPQVTTIVYEKPLQPQTQGSVAYIKAKETQQEWKEVSFDYSNKNYNYSNYDNKNYNYDYDNRNYEYSDKGTSNYSKSFDNSYTDYSNENTNYRTIKTEYGKDQHVAKDCSALSISSQNLSIAAGKEKSVYFALRNFAGEDFKIDSIEAIESSPDFSLEASRDSGTLFAGQSGAINLKVFADESLSDRSSNAYLKVKGHYISGFTCTVISDNFNVSVNGSANISLNEIELNIEEGALLENGSGFVEFELYNPTQNEITVTVFSEDAQISPHRFTFAPNSRGSRVSAVNGLSSNGRVFYSVQSNGSELVQKYTKVQRVALQNNSTEQIQQPQVSASPSPSNNGGFISAGFAALNDSALALGVLIIIIIAAFFAVQWNETKKEPKAEEPQNN
ncbi:MAG TPA: hypothetical protein VJG83_01335 [archaeon]|nr:hypothetical protein [archaeon]